MTTKVRKRIYALLDAIKADFPRRKKAAEELMRQMGLSKTLDLEIESPTTVGSLPSFKPKVSHPLTPMLAARFDYAASWRSGQDVWLSAAEMASYTRQKVVLDYHRALRENWEGSAPMSF